MTTEQVIGLALPLLVMVLGLVGGTLHVLPGATLILLAAVGHRLYFGPTGASTWVLIAMAGLALLSMLVDFLASVLGVRKLGASRRGVCGAIVGSMMGLCFGLPGLLLGPFMGAFLLEQMGGRPAREAAKAGLGAVLGLLAGGLGNFACCLSMIALFTISVWVNSHEHSPGENDSYAERT